MIENSYLIKYPPLDKYVVLDLQEEYVVLDLQEDMRSWVWLKFDHCHFPPFCENIWKVAK